MKKTTSAVLGAAIAAAALATGVAPAQAAPTTFDGSCSFAKLHATTDVPYALFATPITLTVDGPGACTGTANGTRVTKAPVTFHAVVSGRASCYASDGALRGPATIDLGGPTITTDAEVTLSLPVRIGAKLTGAGGTGATGRGRGLILDTALQTPPVVECLNSRSGFFELDATTNGVLVSK